MTIQRQQLGHIRQSFMGWSGSLCLGMRRDSYEPTNLPFEGDPTDI